MARDPLRRRARPPIGDLRVSVTDRCNFRCQYCMPAEGLPWLERDEVLQLRGDRAARRGCWPRWASHDVRLTGGEPLVRRDFPRAGRRCSPRSTASRTSASRPTASCSSATPPRSCAAGRRPLQRLDRLAAARPLLRDDAPRRAAARAARASRRSRAFPEAHPIKVNAVAMRGFTEHEVLPFARVRARAPLRGALHRVHAARRRPRLDARAGADRRRDPRRDPRRLPARARAARAARDRARLPLRRRPGPDRLHQPGLRAVLRRLQPHPPDRRRPPAHLPVLAQRDRPARRRCARAPSDDELEQIDPRRGLAQGAQAPRQRARASSSRRARCSAIGG